MPDLRIGELFSGMGGLGMGVQSVLGGDVVWHSDIDKGACKILAHRYPGVPNLGNITTVNWSTVESVDVLTGGSPCQDLSKAGRRQGMTEGTRSNLWVAMREAIAQLRPPLVVWENVHGTYTAPAVSEVEREAGLLGVRRGEPALRALGRVLGDLSSLGYDARWHGLRASDVGAPHHRLRVFVVASNTRNNPTDHFPRGVGREQGAQRRQGPAVNGAPVRGDRLLAPGPECAGLDDWRELATAIARWSAITGHPAPSLHDDYPVIAEFMMGLPAGWVTDVPGITRNEALRALGNGVVPQQCAAALRLMLGQEVAA